MWPHFLVDCYDCKTKRLDDTAFISNFLEGLVEAINVEKVAGPFTYPFKDPKTGKKMGVSGVVLIAESDLTIHTWPEHNFASVSIFSCKEFDTESAIKYVQKKLRTTDINECLIRRGTKLKEQLSGVDVLKQLEANKQGSIPTKRRREVLNPV